MQTCYVMNICTHSQTHIWIKSQPTVNTRTRTLTENPHSRICSDIILWCVHSHYCNLHTLGGNDYTVQHWSFSLLPWCIRTDRETHQQMQCQYSQPDHVTDSILWIFLFSSSFIFEFNPLPGFVHKSARCQITDRKYDFHRSGTDTEKRAKRRR